MIARQVVSILLLMVVLMPLWGCDFNEEEKVFGYEIKVVNNSFRTYRILFDEEFQFNLEPHSRKIIGDVNKGDHILTAEWERYITEEETSRVVITTTAYCLYVSGDMTVYL